MNEIEKAQSMLSTAEKDLRALKGMSDPNIFADQVFGFHAQQAIEKTLKAWIASLKIDFPFVHNIARLLAILEENGCNIDIFWDMVEFNAYAVAFRYDADEITGEPLDRQNTIERIQKVYDHVKDVIETSPGDSPPDISQNP